MPTTEKRPLKVFLCHAHSDAITVTLLYGRHKMINDAAGYSVHLTGGIRASGRSGLY